MVEMSAADCKELHDLLQKYQLPMVSTQHNLTLIALVQSLQRVQEHKTSIDEPGLRYLVCCIFYILFLFLFFERIEYGNRVTKKIQN